jgi:hypothetical protein
MWLFAAVSAAAGAYFLLWARLRLWTSWTGPLEFVGLLLTSAFMVHVAMNLVSNAGRRALRLTRDGRVLRFDEIAAAGAGVFDITEGDEPAFARLQAEQPGFASVQRRDRSLIATVCTSLHRDTLRARFNRFETVLRTVVRWPTERVDQWSVASGTAIVDVFDANGRSRVRAERESSLDGASIAIAGWEIDPSDHRTQLLVLLAIAPLMYAC